MKNGWLDRLWEAIAEDGRSDRAISKAARLGVNYLSQTRTRGTKPVSEKLAALLDELGEDRALYVMTGVRLTKEAIEALNALADVPNDLRDDALGLILKIGRSARDASPSASEQPLGDPEYPTRTNEETNT